MAERVQKILDHGFVKFIEAYGSDERIIEAARMSTDKGFNGWGSMCSDCNGTGLGPDRLVMSSDGPEDVTQDPCAVCDGKGGTVGDEKLLKYMTPFEMGGLIIEVQAPLFVFREWHRHRVPFGYNEMSARYTPMPDINYVPSIERLMMNAGTSNKQAGTIKGSEEMTESRAATFQEDLRASYGAAQVEYERALHMGVPKELARLVIPVGRYSRMRATGNLRGWLAFLTLRAHPAAQWEIRQFAEAVGKLVADHFPRTWKLFEAKS